MTPPTTPPIRAALLDCFEPALGGVVGSVVVVEAARTLLVWSAVASVVVGDVDVVEGVACAISELVDDVVLLLLSIVLVLAMLGSLDISAGALDVVDEELPDSSSGQIPVVQGSLEQHPS